MQTRIRPGQFYLARFTKNELLVRIEEVAPQGGWIARVLSHGRKVKIKEVSQIIHACDENGVELVADETVPNRRSTALPPVASINNEIRVKEPSKPPVIEQPVYHPIANQQAESLTLLDATAMILREQRKPMSTRELVDAIVAEQLWTPSGKTPWLTLHSALTRDMESKGSRSRFAKSQERGKFTLRK